MNYRYTPKEIGMLNDEIERLRGRLHQHFAFARFVHLWTNRDNVTDAERVSVIKNHPSLRKWVEGGDNEQTPEQKR